MNISYRLKVKNHVPVVQQLRAQSTVTEFDSQHPSQET